MSKQYFRDVTCTQKVWIRFIAQTGKAQWNIQRVGLKPDIFFDILNLSVAYWDM